jgi:hypothetical protein
MNQVSEVFLLNPTVTKIGDTFVMRIWCRQSFPILSFMKETIQEIVVKR